MAKKDLDALKEEMKSPQMGSRSTVCSEASSGVGLGGSGTLARPPALASQYSKIFIPREMEFTGWVTDYKKCSHLGLTDAEVSNFIRDLQRMMPDPFHKHIDWDHTRTEQGTWPTKTFVNMWFKNETNLATMTGLLEIVKEELKKIHYKLRGQEGLGKKGNEPAEEALGEGPCVVLQMPRRSGRKMNLR